MDDDPSFAEHRDSPVVPDVCARSLARKPVSFIGEARIYEVYVRTYPRVVTRESNETRRRREIPGRNRRCSVVGRGRPTDRPIVRYRLVIL